MSTLEHWRFGADGGDWTDVLRRARRPRAPRWTVVAAAGLLLVAAPAVAVVTHALGKDRGPRLTATLRGPDGDAGTITVRVRHTFLATSHGRPGARIFVPTRRGGGVRVPVTWELNLQRDADVASIRLVDRKGARIATLCAPCSARTGRSTITLAKAKFLFQPRATVDVVAGGTTLTGALRLRR